MNFDGLMRREHGRMVALLHRSLGDLELAEDALQQALLIALERWPQEGWPAQPVGWLLRTARNRAIDGLRRRATFDRKRHLLDEDPVFDAPDLEDWELPDERLRLIFTCCHPAIAPAAQVALTLRSVCGLSTEEIARGFLVAEPTLAQRLVRAQRKIRDAGIPYVVPTGEALTERLESVLRVVYLVFTEGYGSSGGDEVVREELCAEAIRLGRWLVRTLPADGEVHGLLALMLLQHARRRARSTAEGELVLLADQDRALWDRGAMDEGRSLVVAALRRGPPGSYALQATIGAVHADAASFDETDWPQIVAVYDLLLRASPSPIVELNRAAAVAMRDGPERSAAHGRTARSAGIAEVLPASLGAGGSASTSGQTAGGGGGLPAGAGTLHEPERAAIPGGASASTHRVSVRGLIRALGLRYASAAASESAMYTFRNPEFLTEPGTFADMIAARDKLAVLVILGDEHTAEGGPGRASILLGHALDVAGRTRGVVVSTAPEQVAPVLGTLADPSDLAGNLDGLVGVLLSADNTIAAVVADADDALSRGKLFFAFADAET